MYGSLMYGLDSTMHSEETNYFVNDSIWLDNFNDLDTNDTTIVEYVWIGGSGHDLRSKARSFPGKPPKSHLDCPEWNFDGSSTGQAPGNDSEVLLRPVAMFRDPFRRDPHKVETWIFFLAFVLSFSKTVKLVVVLESLF
jgi:hypothetical protein